MAAEITGEETGSVSSGTGVTDSGGPETTQFPFYPKQTRVRVSDLCQGPTQSPRHTSSLSPDSPPDMIYPTAAGITGSALSAGGSGGGGGHAYIHGSSTGTGGSVCYSPSSEGPDSRMSPTSAGLDGPTVFPPLPPPPPPPPGYGAFGSVDEGDLQDGPEYEEEEVVFPLSAPPTNQ